MTRIQIDVNLKNTFTFAINAKMFKYNKKVKLEIFVKIYVGIIYVGNYIHHEGCNCQT